MLTHWQYFLLLFNNHIWSAIGKVLGLWLVINKSLISHVAFGCFEDWGRENSEVPVAFKELIIYLESDQRAAPRNSTMWVPKGLRWLKGQSEYAESLIRKVGFDRWVLAKVERQGSEFQKPQLFEEPGKLRDGEPRGNCRNSRDQPCAYRRV